MNKLATLLTMSLLGMSSVASADSSISFDAKLHLQLGTPGSTSVVVRDHRTPTATVIPARSSYWDRTRRPDPRPLPPVVIAPAPSAWMELGTVATGKQTLSLADVDAHFDSLTLKVRGRAELKQVVIQFANKQQQVVKFANLVLSERSSMPVIDLAGSDRAINRIIVYTTATTHGSVTVMGRDRARPEYDAFTRWNKLGSIGTGKQVLKLDTARKYDHVALLASGRVHLNQVLIRFADGQEQLVKLDREMAAGSNASVIDLAGSDRDIASVIVYSDAELQGGFTLYAI